jgi:hypothetical protein
MKPKISCNLSNFFPLNPVNATDGANHNQATESEESMLRGRFTIAAAKV